MSKRLHTPRPVLLGKTVGFGHPAAKNASNIQRTKGGVRCAGYFGTNSTCSGPAMRVQTDYGLPSVTRSETGAAKIAIGCRPLLFLHDLLN